MATRFRWESLGGALTACTAALLFAGSAMGGTEPCGAGAGDCCTSHFLPGCDDAACCEAVCGADPFCCLTTWDAKCVGGAADLCGSLCTPVNNACADALVIGDGVTPYTNSGATDDGAPNALCAFFGNPQIYADVWFNYTASCTGTLTIGLCGSNYDTKMAVYDGFACPASAILACNDDFCGLQSQIVLEVVEGDELKLRVGGYSSTDIGDGIITITCKPGGACPGEGDCCSPHAGVGCEDEACCQLVCGKDPFCCNNSWDMYCASQAVDACACSVPLGACCLKDGTCVDNMDELGCQLLDGTFQGADSTCDLVECRVPPACPDSTHNCFSTGGPGCTDEVCCDIVCALDSYCCEDFWDSICVGEAVDNCASNCGDPTAGDCCAENKSPFCNDRDCCNLICSFDDYCCNFTWDAICADEAMKYPECNCPVPPTGTLSLEAENCQDDFSRESGFQIAVDLWMRDLTTLASGFQAFVDFDDEALNFRGDLSSYSSGPFPLHIIPIASAQSAPGLLTLDGSFPLSSDCCEPHGGTGCSDATCEAIVCAADPWCCSSSWDGTCATEAADLCGDLCAGGTSDDSLLATLVFDVKSGCESSFAFTSLGSFLSELSFQGVPVPTTLVNLDLYYDVEPPVIITPIGIKVNADVQVKTVTPLCPPLPPLSNCCSPGGGPGCDDAACQALVCAADSWCCTSGWDGMCVDEAEKFCGDLCFPDFGDSTCCAPHGGIGCDNFDCQSTVCTLDPFCCNTAWDLQCASEAVDLCSSSEVVTDPCLGAVVEYEAIAQDNCEVVFFKCYPPSGSFFPIGQTSVSCVAVDACGNQSEASFIVEVNPFNTVKAQVVLVGSEETSRCIHFVVDDCGTTVDLELIFEYPDGDSSLDPVGYAEFSVPCNLWSFLCGKDQQHTKWDTVGLIADGTAWVAEGPIVLLPGDTDNDGDVDINDVTWLVATFGDFAASGGCPWDGTRDADFNNGGAVQSEDYSLLSGQFLTKSECLCTLPAFAQSLDRRTSLPIGALSPAARAADVDRNGVFDWRDVDAFERANGLPATLSQRMRMAR